MRRSGRDARAMAAVCLALFAVVAVGGAEAVRCGSVAGAANRCLRVLFVGNSFTFVNDLPSLVRRLAVAGGHRVETGLAAGGGWSLRRHVASPETVAKLDAARWDTVVLQEQSELPAFAERADLMYPAARHLVRAVRDAGAQPMFFLTWAPRDGRPQYGFRGYPQMQDAVNNGYRDIAEELHVPIAPVGPAWSMMRDRGAGAALYQDDGSHPAAAGTYLAACVFYAALFGESPAGLPYRAGLPRRDAALAQAVAAEAVLNRPDRWRP